MTLEDLNELNKQEAILVFPKFDLEDAYALGTKLYADGQTEPKPIAIRIILDDLIVFQAFMPGTNETNHGWMNRKCATVNRTHHCSLWALAEKEVFGAIDGKIEAWHTDEAHYAFCGGGFPIFVRNDDGKKEFRGIAVISGLPHLQDHRRLTQSIAEYLCDRKGLREKYLKDLPENMTEEEVRSASAWDLLVHDSYSDPAN